MGTVVEQSNHAPMTSAAIWQPAGTSPSPNRQYLPANVIAVTEKQSLFCAIQPIFVDSHVVIGCDKDFAAGCKNAGIQRRASSLVAFKDVTERSGKPTLS